MGSSHWGAVKEHDVPWARVSADDYARWWFETSRIVELTEMLLVSPHQAGRLPRGRVHGSARLGSAMLLAVATATCVVKDGLTVGEAFKTAMHIAGSRAGDLGPPAAVPRYRAQFRDNQGP
ncbi:hypothetical protein ACWCOW_41615 [Streptomyces sp. NPDC001939]